MIPIGKLSTLAHAKVNLSLDILSKMDDGYHELKTVMQTVSLADEVTVECISDPDGSPSAKPGTVSVSTGLSYIPNDQRNIAAKAADVFFRHTGISLGGTARIGIQIKKNIPVCAGLGGGSADAACVLRILDKMFETSLGRAALEELGGTVGADVPFCISGGTKLAGGRGEILTDLPPLPKCFVLICKPPFSCSTPELFGRVICSKIRERPDTEGLLKAINAHDIGGIARRMYNVFEDILPKGKSDIESIKGIMIEHGALGAVMTGSGSSVFGIFDNEAYAREAHKALSGTYSECFLAETIG